MLVEFGEHPDIFGARVDANREPKEPGRGGRRGAAGGEDPAAFRASDIA